MPRKAEAAVKRSEMLSWRTTIAGKRYFKTWCAARRLDVSAVTRDAVVEYMKRHDTDIPEIAGRTTGNVDDV